MQNIKKFRPRNKLAIMPQSCFFMTPEKDAIFQTPSIIKILRVKILNCISKLNLVLPLSFNEIFKILELLEVLEIKETKVTNLPF